MLADIHLENFRSYQNASFDLSPNVNVIVGPNASGKTNLLESILVLSTGHSYRAKDFEMVQFKKTWARIDANLSNNSKRTVKLKLDGQKEKTYELDKKAYRRLSFQHTLPVVVFEPNHLLLLSGGPDRRRDYLDDLLERNTIGYSKQRRQYKQALAQRNALLKQVPSPDKAQIFPWNVRLSELAGNIVKARVGLIETLNKTAPALYKEINQVKTNVALTYETNLSLDNYETGLLKVLESNIDNDRMRGFTSSGPHREDMEVTLNGHPVQEVASRGETRSIILSLKIAELEMIKHTRDLAPMFLLDDVFSELDGKRRHGLATYLSSYQTFITTTDSDFALEGFMDKCLVIPL